MPPFAAFLPLIAQGVSTIGNAISGTSQNRRNINFQREANAQNIAHQNQTNATQMAFQREMYGLQRQHNLEDFTRQNEYDSPTSQMARLKEAGLNPHLVYGSGATQNAAPIRSASPTSANIQAPQVHAPQVDNRLIAQAANLAPYFQMQNMAQTHDNLKAMNEKLAAETNLSKAKGITEILNSTLMKEKLSEAQRNNLIEAATQWIRIESEGLKNDQLKANLDYTRDANTRAESANVQSLKESAERILTSQAERGLIPLKAAQIQSFLQSESMNRRLRAIETQIRETGGNPNDPAWQRYLQEAIKIGLEKVGYKPKLY